MLFGETVAVYCENHKKHVYTAWAECRVVHIGTTGLYKVLKVEVVMRRLHIPLFFQKLILLRSLNYIHDEIKSWLISQFISERFIILCLV
jgi:hypothetical protein